MTKRTDSPVVRHWLGRAAALAGATLLLSLSAGPGAHADGGLLGDVPEVVGGVTQPVVEPVVQTVQSAVPQPVQQAVEPAVSQVVEPAVSHAEQTVKTAVKGAEQAAPPVVEVVKLDVRPAEEPVREPEAEAADRVVTAAPQAPVANGPTGSHAVDASGHKGTRPVSAAPREPRDDRRPSAAAHRTDVPDLASRTMAGTAIVQPSCELDGLCADQELWSLTNALMHMWARDNVPGSVNAGLPGDAGISARALGTLPMAPLLLGLLMGCLSLVHARRLVA